MNDPNLEVDVPFVVGIKDDPDVQIIDVRERDEWDAGHMKESTLIPLSEFAVRVGEIDATRPVVIVCRSGSRSLMVAQALADRGFTEPKSLAGGLIAWAEAGHELI